MTQKHRTENGTSRLSKTIVVLICVVPAVAAIAYGAVDAWSIGLLSILIAIIALLWLIDAGIKGELSFNTSALQLPLLGLVLIGCIQLLPFASRDYASVLNIPAVQTLSMDPYATRFFLMRMVICLVFFAAALAYLPGGKRQDRTAFYVVAFGTLIAFFGILQRLMTPESIYGLRPTPYAVPFGPFVNQHHFAALMEMTSGVAFGLLFGGGIAREGKFFVALAAGIMGMAIVFTGSRGGMISYLGVIAFAVVTSFVWGSDPSERRDEEARSQGRRNLMVLTAAGGLLLLVLGSVLFLGGETSLIRSIGLQGPESDVTNGRAHFWAIAWQIFLDHPVMGAGFDAFGVAFSQYDTWHGLYRVEQAHNDYLQTLADGGILAFGCVAAFVWLLVRKGIGAVSRRTSDIRRSISTGALAGCFGILIHSFFDFPLRTPANAFFFLLLVVLAVGHGAEKKSRNR